MYIANWLHRHCIYNAGSKADMINKEKDYLVGKYTPFALESKAELIATACIASIASYVRCSYVYVLYLAILAIP